MDPNQPLGIFDSGLGGLTVASAIKHLLPNERIIYVGDTAHLPYGDKSAASIVHYSETITDFLLRKNCKTILVACNTASARAYSQLAGHVGNKATLIDVIEPVVNFVVQKYPSSKIGVIGTKNTIDSNTYPYGIKEKIPSAEVVSMAAPLLVPMIEEGFIYDDISNAIIRSYLSGETFRGIKVLILGCTHYPIIKNQIRKFFDFNVEVIDSAAIVARYVKDKLESQNLLSGKRNNAEDMFYVSDYTDYFGKVGQMFFDDKINLTKIDLWK